MRRSSYKELRALQKGRRDGGLGIDIRPPHPHTEPSAEPDDDMGAEPKSANSTIHETGTDVTTTPASDVSITTTVISGNGKETSKCKYEPTCQNGSLGGHTCDDATGNVESVATRPPRDDAGTAAMLEDDPETVNAEVPASRRCQPSGAVAAVGVLPRQPRVDTLSSPALERPAAPAVADPPPTHQLPPGAVRAPPGMI
jgi:hypothetical protein